MLHKFILFSVYLAVLLDCSSATCRAGDFSCTNDKCIPIIWKCDKEDDCGDNSDEENCDNAGCHVGEFSCKNDKCIPYKWQCDKEDDCGDGSDEENCGVSVCSPEEISCRNGRCINATLRCNTENDCGDNSDEEECDAVCDAGFIACSNGHCIPLPWQCDGTFDCPDKSDEENCTFTIKEECDKHSEFDCGKNKCIPIGLVCNKENDCGESEDEPSDKCSVNECLLNNGGCPQLCVDDNYGFHCECHDGYHLDGNGSCISSTIKEECDKDTEFDCGNNTCIPIGLVCNKENDCGESEDEPSDKCFVNECLLNNGGCPQLCVDDNYGFHCNCHDGYHLEGNGSCISSTIKEECDKDREFDCGNNTCIPIGLVCNKENDCGDSEDEPSYKCFVNECLLNNGGCPQLCVDDNYGFHCECHDGYHLDGNGSCIVKRESLLFKNESDLLILVIETGEKKTIFSGLGMPIALDYDFENDVIVWGDTKNKSIHRLDILNGTSLFDANSSYVDTVVMDKVDIEGLAVDWIYGNVYWTDRTEKSINVATLDGNMTTVLFKNNISKPRAIAVNPLEGWLFWTDWGRNPKIERAGMDGTHRSVIISENITWPNGLAIDYETKRLFWTDGRLHSLSSSDYDGSNVQVILSSRSLVSRAFAIDVFQDSLYWNEWTTKSIKRVNKFNGKNFEIVVSKLYFPGALKVYHPLKQPKGINYCINTNSSCSHFCLPAPQVTVESVKFTCFCPTGMILAHDGRVCRTVE